MSAFYMWQPFVQPDQPQTLMFVLMAELGDSAAPGTRQFITQLLRDMRIKAKVQGWTLTPYRTAYYSQEDEPPHWRDRWQAVRLAHVTLDAPVKVRGELGESDADDTSETKDTELNETTPAGCLVISDFATLDQWAQALSVMTTDPTLQTLRNAAGAGEPVVTVVPMLHEGEPVQHVIIDLGQFPPSFFADGAEYAEQVTTLCQQFGGATNFYESLPELVQ